MLSVLTLDNSINDVSGYSVLRTLKFFLQLNLMLNRTLYFLNYKKRSNDTIALYYFMFLYNDIFKRNSLVSYCEEDHNTHDTTNV